MSERDALPQRGDWIRYRSLGEWWYARYLGDAQTPGMHQVFGEDQVPDGATVHTVVWKVDRVPLIRKTHKHQPRPARIEEHP